MQIEYEVRVLEIQKEEMEKRLAELGAVKRGEYDQRRYVYDFNPKIPGKWIRLRTNGKKTTLTIKQVLQKELDGTRELELEVSDFETANQLLEQLGYPSKSYQENRRIQYTLSGVEIDIDTWPLIPTYMEIEGSSTEEVEKMIEKIGVNQDKITTLDVQSVYQEIYGIDLSKIDVLKF